MFRAQTRRGIRGRLHISLSFSRSSKYRVRGVGERGRLQSFALLASHFWATWLARLQISDRGPRRVTKGQPDQSVGKGCRFGAILRAVGPPPSVPGPPQQTPPQSPLRRPLAFGLSKRPAAWPLREVHSH